MLCMMLVAALALRAQERPAETLQVMQPAEGAPPNITLVSPKHDTEAPGLLIDVEIHAAASRPLARVELTINGQPALPDAVKALTVTRPAQTKQAFRLRLPLPVNGTRFTLRAVAEDAQGAKSAPAEATVYLPGARATAEKVFVLSAGISRYQAADVPVLRFAAADAEAIGKLFQDNKVQVPCTKGVQTQIILNDGVTVPGLLSALRGVRDSAGPDDLVIIYLALHRVRDAAGNLFLATHEVNMASISQSALSWRIFVDTINSFRTKRVVVLADIGRGESAQGKLLDAQPWASYAAKPEQTLISQGDWGQSAFARAAVEGLRGKADSEKKNGIVTLGELFTYTGKRVAELTEGKQQPQHPNLTAFDAKRTEIGLTWTVLPRLEKMTVPALTALLESGEPGVQLQDHTGRTLLHHAVVAERVDLIELLLARGADVNAADSTGAAPLHFAAAMGKPAIVQALLAKGANLSARDLGNRTPLEMARVYEQAEIIDFILRAAAPDIRDEHGRVPLHLAVMTRRVAALKQLLANKPDLEAADAEGNTPLHLAVQLGDQECAGLLLAAGAKAQAQNAAGATPLHLGVEKNQGKMVTLLLENRANANAQDKEGRTALHLAASNSFLEIIDLLAARGANFNLGDKDGTAPLHAAVIAQNAAVVKRLLARGANINVEDKSLYTPLHWAATLDKLEMLELLIAGKPNLNARDKDGYTPMHVAAWFNRVAHLTLLVKAGGQVNAKSKAGLTPLALAKKNKAEAAADYLAKNGGY